MTDKQAYENKLEAQLKEWQADIDKFKAKAQEASADAQIKHEAQLQELRSQRDDVHSRLEAVQNASSDAWKDVKKGADAAWDSMSDSMRQAWNRFS